MQLSSQQSFNQALIQLAVLLYQIDGKVTLTEQEYLDSVIEEMCWESPISIDAFLTEAIYQTRKALDEGKGIELLKSLKEHLLHDVDKAMEVAMQITGIDGERNEKETEVLSLLTHKLLAKALVCKDALTPPSPTQSFS
ncbi:tellurite resistance TerB family protein [Alteromonas sp. ASW11-130]|uniref:tellurite resistance TerB family protein n=1 Tax=Alteromonas sp. ASW11-130 TaxID=3015775 RepID=UPI002241B77E|nr:TerB family tellurite resistance protein [Alteromonas sp. ASW11-130]MCW8091453.1 TerB family tellurite resistance protein [Alteromonas sp. ASW11-130]